MDHRTRVSGEWGVKKPGFTRPRGDVGDPNFPLVEGQVNKARNYLSASRTNHHTLKFRIKNEISTPEFDFYPESLGYGASRVRRLGTQKE